MKLLDKIPKESYGSALAAAQHKAIIEILLDKEIISRDELFAKMAECLEISQEELEKILREVKGEAK